MRSRFLLLCLLLSACATPYGDSASLLGGASAERIDDHAYEVRASINGYSNPGVLKPMILRKAKLVGGEAGFQSFQIDRVRLRSDFPVSGGYSAHATVRFFRTPVTSADSSFYSVVEPDSFRESPTQHDVAGFARIGGGSPFIKRLNQTAYLKPVFLNAVAIEGSSFTTPVAYVLPGAQTLVVHVIMHPVLRFLTFECSFTAGKGYAVAGEYDDEWLHVSIEESTTRHAACDAQRISVPLPQWAR